MTEMNPSEQKSWDIGETDERYEQRGESEVERLRRAALLAKRAIDQLIELQSLDDPKGAHAINIQRSYAHGRADQIICRLLSDLGYGDVVREFEKIDRWYA